MKNLNNNQKVAASLQLLRETHSYDKAEVGTLLGLNVKEYCKLERGSRALNLEHLCILSTFYKVRKSAILDYGNPNREDTTEAIQDTLRQLEASQKWLKEIQNKIALLQMKANSRVVA
jgi:transcriptional regulator with XRE-family HTH domain